MAPTPNEEILTFLQSLPATVRPQVYANIIGVFQPQDLGGATDMDGVVVTLLFAAAPMHQAGAAILMAGALDYIFAANRQMDADFLSQLAKEEDAPILEQLALEVPLKGRHFEQAMRDWARLRGSSLSAEALHRFQLAQVSRAIR